MGIERVKAGSSSNDCWKLFVDNSILISIKAHILQKGTENEPNFLFIV